MLIEKYTEIKSVFRKNTSVSMGGEHDVTVFVDGFAVLCLVTFDALDVVNEREPRMLGDELRTVDFGRI
ncbi:hypothetical protein HED50_18650 [Ochrobactrum oryzae]|mgnify:CR=1 FL=1|nr:hypothetical protein [Brucella oryzae]